MLDKPGVKVNIDGGGQRSAGAVRHGIARALISYDEARQHSRSICLPGYRLQLVLVILLFRIPAFTGMAGEGRNPFSCYSILRWIA